MSINELLAPSWSTTFISRRGTAVGVRRLTATDTALLVDLFDHLSIRTRYLRFFSPLTNLSAEEVATHAAQLCCLNADREEALVGLVEQDGGEQHAVGIARFALCPGTTEIAEAALVVRDDYQREGIGRSLFRILVEVARARGITTFTAITIAENYAVLQALRSSGVRFHIQTQRGESRVEIYL